MRKIIGIFKQAKRACHVCHGMGVLELPSGNTKTCPACNGKGTL